MKSAGNVMKILNVFTLIFLLIIMEMASADNISASVDRLNIGENETLTLSITYDDASTSEQPNLGGLENIFEIVNSATSSETRIINGSISSIKKWRYTLAPKKPGKLLIPSFSIKDSYSDPIEIEVVDNAKLHSTQGENHGDLFVEAAVNKREAYVQEMITLTLRIYTSVQIAQPKLPELTLPGFMIEKIGDGQFETRQADRNYYVLEYRYALFPHKSGDFSIPKQRYQIAQIISNGPRSLFDIRDFGTQTQARFLSTSEIPIQVHAVPADNPASYWMASDDVTLTDNLVADQNMELGTPVTRRIEVKALGNLAANIPPLPEDMPRNLKSYREQPLLDNARAGDTLLATRTESMAIVAVEPGEYTLPEIQLHWWSNKEKKFKTSTLPERRITVRGTAASNELPMPSPIAGSAIESPQNTNIEPGRPPAEIALYLNVYLWIGISMGLFILVVVLFVLFIHKKSKSPKVSLTEETPQQLIKNSFRDLKQACQKHDAQQARNAIIYWAQKKWQHETLLTLNDIKQKINNATFNQLANELDAALYKETAHWDGQPMLDFLGSDGFLFNEPDRTIHSKEPSLPGLYN